MKKHNLARKYRFANPAIKDAINKFESRISGKPGAEDRREKFAAALDRITTGLQDNRPPYRPHDVRYRAWKTRCALDLARKAGQYFDEHGSWGSSRGDYRVTTALDFIPPWESSPAPYCDMGGEGLGLIAVERTRYYAKRSSWRPSSVTTHYLVGRNEAGTYFAHPVPTHCATVRDAVQWIWNGMADRIIQRQGDIALIWGNGGPKLPELPWGHRIEGNFIVHETHPPLPLPGKGQRVIVARRAAERANAATRD